MGYGDEEYRWIADAPLEVFEGEKEEHTQKFKQYTLWLGYDMKAYVKGLSDATQANAHIGKTSHAHQSQNIGGAKRMLTTFQTQDVLKPGRVAVAYMLGNRPVAMLVLMRGTGWVCDVLSHPGVKGAGGIMIEWAVNFRVQEEKAEPKLGLYPLTEAARDSYAVLGFQSDAKKNSSMNLDVTSVHAQKKWERRYNEWRYISSSRPNAQGYLSTDADALGVLPPVEDEN